MQINSGNSNKKNGYKISAIMIQIVLFSKTLLHQDLNTNTDRISFIQLELETGLVSIA